MFLLMKIKTNKLLGLEAIKSKQGFFWQGDRYHGVPSQLH